MVVPHLDVHAFAAIPSRLARDLRPHVGRAVEGVLGAQTEDEPAGVSGHGTVREVVEQALRHFYDLVEDPRPVVWERVAGHYAELGRRLADDPPSVDRMHQLMFRSARALWHTLDALVTVDFDETMLGLIAEAQFGFIEACSTALSQGYRSQQPEDPELRRQRRRKLLELLTADQRPEESVVGELAKQAGWPLPKAAAVAVLRPRDGYDMAQSLMVPEEMLVGSANGPFLLIPDPDGPGRDRLLRPLLRDWIVAVGPTMSPMRAAESLRWAKDAMTLAIRGVIADDDVIVSTDHVPTLVIFHAEGLIGSAADARLAPLSEVPTTHRERLLETLLALLESKFNATEAALRLHVHPQTVRYRARQLEQLFGEELRDPRGCLELEMILHARLAGTRPRPSSATPPAARGTARDRGAGAVPALS
ncbi:helix-turn-helix domain-containing protein [Thermomonospora umbrina]|uniref:PucR-like helix-turn-helix protein n=1 Tax=Thermomonospora umbrina TaxID=111806 RepID=A0A3D9SYZ0_9ACTN|nr:helix-turn-helix domain-containing protein [Thermomonospora umbrina]REE97784.1 PucR-like helix-turn-helix protein [Thermomonospora umbrina]